MTEIAYQRPYLYQQQHDAIFSGKRWSLCEATTKSGKTVGSIVRIIEWGLFGNGKVKAAPGQHYWWVAPISSQARIAFSRVKQHLTPGSFSVRENPEPSITMITGPTIVFKSGDNADSLYGEDVYGAVIDEASRNKPEVWYAIRSTLTATRGPAVLIGNVKGRRNWFYEWCRRVEAGNDPNAHFERITWKDAVRAGVLDADEIEDARRNLPENVFKELYEAEASEDGGNPFGEAHILACISKGLSKKPPVAFGVDLAKKQDYLVVIGLDEAGAVCRFERWQGKPWPDSIRDIHRIVGEDVPALIDSTGLGDPVLDDLQIGHGNFTGYVFTPRSKQRLMEGLAVSIQSHEVTFPDGPIKNELLAFEYAITRTGYSYSAPEGWNDDCVCALALARQKWAETAPGANLMQFWDEQLSASRKQDAHAAQQHVAQTLGEEFLDTLADAPGIENELTELYMNAFAERTQPKRKHCAGCGEAVIGNARVTDGEFIWHPGCQGFGALRNLH